MARRTSPMDQFIKKVLVEAFALSEARFAVVKDERKRKIILSTLTQLGGVVPERFLSFVETAKDPKALVQRMVTKMNGLPPPMQIQTEPGEFDKEHVLEEAAVQMVHSIVFQIFAAPPKLSEYSPLMQDLKELHTFLKRKRADASTSRQGASNGDDEDDHKVDLGPDDKTKLVEQFSQSLISISALFRKNEDPSINTGQYL